MRTADATETPPRPPHQLPRFRRADAALPSSGLEERALEERLQLVHAIQRKDAATYWSGRTRTTTPSRDSSRSSKMSLLDQCEGGAAAYTFSQSVRPSGPVFGWNSSGGAVVTSRSS